MTLRRYGPYSFETTNEDKVLFPGSGFTKGDLIDYYEAIAEVMVPYLRDRPLTLERFPDGIEGEHFFQKEAPEHLPQWIERVSLATSDGRQNQIVCQNQATLAYLGQLACLTLHVWSSRRPQLDHPDQLIFDLDPDDDEDSGFAEVRWAALRCRELLEQLGLVSFVKLTGSRGAHLVSPLDRSSDFDTVRAFTRGVAELLARRHPERLTVEQRIDRRRGRLYLDTARNAYGQTTVAPYSVRAREGVPVAMPVEWHQLEGGKLGACTFDTKSALRFVERHGDPWHAMRRHARSLVRPRRRLRRLLEECAA